MVAIFTGLGAGFERGSGSVLGSSGLLGSATLGRGGDQVFLNAANGNLMISRQDEFLVGVGPDVSITRTYNSEGNLSDNNGNNTSDNWRFESERKVFGLTGTLNSAGSTIHRMSADGSDITYTWDATRLVYLATDGAGASDTLTCTSNVWTWTDGDTQIKETYAADPSPLRSGSYRITKETNADGYYVTYTYDDANSGRIQSVASSDGEYVQFDWSQYATNRKVAVETFAGAQVGGSTPTLTRAYYTYDTSNRLQTVTVDLSPNDNSTGDGQIYTTTYGYDASNRVNSISQTDGSRIDVTYDTSGRVLTIAQTASNGVTRTSSVSYNTGYTTVTDPLGQTVRLDYDASGNLTKVTMPPVGGASQVTQFTYNATGDLLTVKDPLNATTTYTYDAVGPELVTNGDGSSTAGWSTSHASLSLSGGALTVTSDNTGNQDYAYQQITGLTIGKKYIFSCDFGASNGLGSPEFLLGSTANGSDIATFTATASSGKHTYSFVATSTSVYVTLRSVSTGNGWSCSFDNMSLKRLPADGEWTTKTDSLSNVTTRTYGLKGELLTETTTSSDTSSPLATHTVRYVYDAENHLRYRISDVLDRTANPNAVKGEVTEYRYTGQGWLYFTATYPEQTYDTSALASNQAPTEADVTAWRDALPDRSSTDITYNSFDVRGNLLQSTDYSIATTAGVQTSTEGYSRFNFVYDQAGQLLSRYAQGRNTETFVYDGLGRLISAVDVNGGTTSYLFDDINSRTVVTLASGLIQTSTYNKAGELISYTESALANNASDFTNSSQWTASGGTLTGSGVLGDSTQTLTVSTSGQPASLQHTEAVVSGDTITMEVSLQAASATLTSSDLGIFGDVDGWGTAVQSSAVIVSGPGTLTRSTGGLWTISGLSTTGATRIRISRTFGTAENALCKVYAGASGATAQAGNAIKFALPSVTHALGTQLTAASGTATSGYDKDGRLRWHIDATGRKSYIIYDAVGRKVADISRTGDIVEYRYDADDRLIATISYATRLTAAQISILDGENLDTETTIFSLSSLGTLTTSSDDLWTWRIYDSEGRLTQAIEGDGSTTIYTYDGNGRLITTTAYATRLNVTGFKTVLPSTLQTPATAAGDEISRLFYDDEGRIVATLDAKGFLTWNIYDHAGQKTQVIAYANAATAAAGYTLANASLKNISVVADSTRDQTTHYVYDGQGQLRFVVDAQNHVTERRFDNAAQQTTLIRYYNALPAGTTDFTYDYIKGTNGTTGVAAAGFADPTRDRISYTVYDTAGRVSYTLDVYGSSSEAVVTGFTYNSAGQLTKTVQYASVRTTTALPSKATMDSWITATSVANNVDNRITRNYYDGAGVLRYIVDGEGYVTRRTEDAEGREVQLTRWDAAISVTDSDTTSSVLAKLGSGRVDTYKSYDADGRLNATYDGEGVVHRFEYNANGTLLYDIVAWGTPDETRTKFVYDANGRVTAEYRAFNPVDGTAKAIVQYGYDAFGNVTKVIDPRNTISYRYYDQNNNLTVTCEDATGFKYVTERTYNAFGQVTSETRRYNSASSVPLPGAGVPTVATNNLDSITYTYYDALGRVTMVGEAKSTTVNGTDYYGTKTTYTPWGEVASVTRYYDVANNAAQVSVAVAPTFTANTSDATTAFDYDRLGRVIKTTDAEGYFESYGYNAFSNRTSVTKKSNGIDANGNRLVGGTIVNTYDRRGLLLTETLPMPSMDTAGNQVTGAVTNRFEYDARGNRTKMVEGDGLAIARTTNYEYDAADRLIKKYGDAVATLAQADSTNITSPVPTEYYQYDARGNLVQVTDALAGRTVSYYDALNRKTDEVNATGTLTHWDYDAVGNVLDKKVYGDAVTVPVYPVAPNLADDIIADWTESGVTSSAAEPINGGAAVKFTATTDDAAATVRYQPTVSAGETYTWDISLQASGLLTSAEIGVFGTTSQWGADADSMAMIISGPGEIVRTSGGLWKVVGLSTTEPTRISITRTFNIAAGTTETGKLIAYIGPKSTTAINAGDSLILGAPVVFKGSLSPAAAPTGNEANVRRTDYEYDTLGRLWKTKVLGAQNVGVYNGSTGVTTANQDLISTVTYDSFGNVIQATDANLNNVYSWYDKMGRKIAQVDQERYLTAWTYDGEGNVLSETRYATAIPTTTTITTSSDPAALANAAGTSADDRITNFTYDKNGRRLSETRTGVEAWSVSSSNGTLTQLSTSQAIYYTYNGLGEVLTKTEATGDAVTYTYDQMGRLTKEIRASYTDRSDNRLFNNGFGGTTGWTVDNPNSIVSGSLITGSSSGTTYLKAALSATTSGQTVTLRTDDTHAVAVAVGERLLVEAGVEVTGIAGSAQLVVDYLNSSGTLLSSTTVGTLSGNQTFNTKISGVITVPTGAAKIRLRLVTTTSGAGSGSISMVDPIIEKIAASKTNNIVTPEVIYSYNALNNLTRTQQGDLAVIEADKTAGRITTYTYDKAGRLATMTDPANGTHTYLYDIAGNLLRDSYVRTKSDGTTVTDGILYTRDLLGRVTSQCIATNTGTSWTKGDTQDTHYNGYGDVDQRGINGMAQEHFYYNNRGLLEKTNTGDGVWRFFVYDKVGNQVLAIEDENYAPNNVSVDLGTKTITDVLGYVGSTAGASFVDGLNCTISLYNKRNQATQTIQTQREAIPVGSTQVSKLSLINSQTYNAFGEVASQTDAIGNSDGTQATKDAHTTYFYYNTMGRLTKKVLPAVYYTDENGNVSAAAVTPIENYYYDRAGRLVATKDANGNTTSRVLLAGSGYGGSDALVTAEYHPDGGIAKTFYDVFGDARVARNELNLDETRTYDGMGRLITETHRGYNDWITNAWMQLTDNYTYDLLGQRLTHWNSLLGSLNKETTDYDRQGRVEKVVAFGGDTTTTDTQWDATIDTTGMGTFGGWTETTKYYCGSNIAANFVRDSVSKSDLFGHDVSKEDLGDHYFTYSYDKAGRQTARIAFANINDTTADETLTTEWFNTGLVSKLSLTATDYTTSAYDMNGNKRTETTVRGGVTYENATTTYDALNRMVTWNEAGNSNSGNTGMKDASKLLEYDLNGNIRRDKTITYALGLQGTPDATPITEDMYFKYDSMNRVTVNDGALVNGQITFGSAALWSTKFITYDVAGRRVSVDTVSNAYVYSELTEEQYPYVYHYREDYSYNGDGTLKTIRTAETTYTGGRTGPPTIIDAPAVGALKSNFTYDEMGRQTRQVDWLGDGTNGGYDHTVVFNAKGQVTTDTTISKHVNVNTSGGYDTYVDTITNNYGSGIGYALGQVVSSSDVTSKSGTSDPPDTSTTNYFAWYDGAVQSSMTFDSDTGSSSNTLFTTTYNLSPSGVLNSAHVADGRVRDIYWVNDMNGQAIRRDEADSLQTGDPHSVWYRFNGVEVSNSFNVEDKTKMTEKRAIADRTAAVTGYVFSGGGFPDGDASYDNVNSYKQGAAGGRYVVQGGETLQGIAQATWGDSSLWYKIAEANGLSGDGMLVEGQTLTLPAGVTRSKNNAATFKPYDASEAIGNTSPTNPKPPKKAGSKCGVFGAVLLIAIAVAVTIVASGAALAALSPAVHGIGAGIATMLGTSGAVAGVGGAGVIAAGAIGGAVGSIVSQGVGVATGLQDKFSWKGVALAALAGGVGAGLGPNGAFGKLGAFGRIGSPVISAGLRGATASAITQGVGVVTGLQDKFDWAGVAAAGVGSMAGQMVGGQAAGLGKFGQRLFTNMASGVANAATRSLINGTDFGDNVMAALPDIIGQTVGGLVEGLAKGEHSVISDDPWKKGVKVAYNGKGWLPGGYSLEDFRQAPAKLSAGLAAWWEGEKAKLFGSPPPDPHAIVVTGIRPPPQHGFLYNLFHPAVQSFYNFMGWNGSPSRPSGGTRISYGQPGVRRGLGYDIMGQPLNGRSNYHPLTQLGRILSDIPNVPVVTSAARLGQWSTYSTPDATARNAALFDPYRGMTPQGRAVAMELDRRTSGTIAGISYGVAGELGVSQRNREYVYNLGTAADDALLAAGGLRGASIPGSNNQTSFAIEGTLRLKYKPGWTEEQRTAADLKVGVLGVSDAVVSESVRGGFSARSVFEEEYGSVSSDYDIDHLLDLQLGGRNALENLWPLDYSVNRSLGRQIQTQIDGLPPGMRITRITIGD